VLTVRKTVHTTLYAAPVLLDYTRAIKYHGARMDTKSRDVALFRYQLIAPLLNDTEASHKVYLAKITSREHRMPGYETPQTVTVPAMKKWLHRYRTLGFDGLMPRSRRDKGGFRTINTLQETTIRQAIGEHKFRTARALLRYLIAREVLVPDSCSYSTFVTFAKKKKLLTPGLSNEAYKSFEKSHINMLWIGDFLYGPFVRNGKNNERTYLLAIIDDHSRFIVGAEFFHEQDSGAVAVVLKRAFETYGTPQKLYLDNGKVFVQDRLNVIAARLGVRIVHSKPYRPEGRGKIERFFRTVRDCFLDDFLASRRADGDPFVLSDLNQAFDRWLCDSYQNAVHSSTEETPHARYMHGIASVTVRRPSPDSIRRAFFVEYERKVSPQAIVSIDTIEYEVPGTYIGQAITIYKDEMCDGSAPMMICENGEFITIREVNRHQNAEFPIRYPDSTNNF
jgi:transposase InsO family protein